MNATELPKRLQNSLRRIERQGGVILLHHTSMGSVCYQLQNGGEVSPSVIQRLRDVGLLASGLDGLFGGDEQTLHLAPQ